MSTTLIVAGAVIAAIIIFIVVRGPSADRGQQKSVAAVTRKEQKTVNDDEIRNILKQGNKIEAIKMYRELHGVDLAQAKAAVEAME